MKMFKRDERIADEVNRDAQEERRLNCQAAGCNSRWSIDFGNGRWCSRHDKAPKQSTGNPAPDRIKALLATAVRRMP